ADRPPWPRARPVPRPGPAVDAPGVARVGSRRCSRRGLARLDPLGAEVAGKGAAAADLAFDPEPGVVQVEDVLDDRQAQPGAARFARAAGGHPVEALG